MLAQGELKNGQTVNSTNFDHMLYWNNEPNNKLYLNFWSERYEKCRRASGPMHIFFFISEHIFCQNLKTTQYIHFILNL